MAVIGDIYMVSHHQSWFHGEGLSNVYFYERSGPEGDAPKLLTAFFEGVLPFILDIQNPQVYTERIQVVNLGALEDFAEATYSGVQGTYGSGDFLPIFNAVNITLRLNTRAVRPGSKRYAGINESAVTGGIITASDLISNINDLMNALKDTLDADETPNVFRPIVLKRVKEGPEGGPYTYRLPETNGETHFGYIINTLVNLNVSHQVSRGNSR